MLCCAVLCCAVLHFCNLSVTDGSPTTWIQETGPVPEVVQGNETRPGDWQATRQLADFISTASKQDKPWVGVLVRRLAMRVPALTLPRCAAQVGFHGASIMHREWLALKKLSR